MNASHIAATHTNTTKSVRIVPPTLNIFDRLREDVQIVILLEGTRSAAKTLVIVCRMSRYPQGSVLRLVSPGKGTALHAAGTVDFDFTGAKELGSLHAASKVAGIRGLW